VKVLIVDEGRERASVGAARASVAAGRSVGVGCPPAHGSGSLVVAARGLQRPVRCVLGWPPLRSRQRRPGVRSSGFPPTDNRSAPDATIARAARHGVDLTAHRGEAVLEDTLAPIGRASDQAEHPS
jgi:hypothetical protein